jgi:hypothetical protein
MARHMISYTMENVAGRDEGDLGGKEAEDTAALPDVTP